LLFKLIKADVDFGSKNAPNTPIADFFIKLLLSDILLFVFINRLNYKK